MNPLGRVAEYLFRYRGLFALTLIMAAAMTVLGVSVPWVIQDTLDRLFADTEMETAMLLRGIALVAGLYLAREVFNCLRIRVNNVLEQKVILDLRRDLHDKLLALPISFYDRRKSGDVASRGRHRIARARPGVAAQTLCRRVCRGAGGRDHRGARSCVARRAPRRRCSLRNRVT